MEIVEEKTRDFPILPENLTEGAMKSDEMLITEDTFEKMDVPSDRSCLFWAVTTSYLLPVRNNENLFSKRFVKLFGLENVNETLHVQKLILNQPLNIVYEDGALMELVTKVFRNRVVDEMMKQEEELHQSVTLDDFMYMQNEVFITDGTFAALFKSTFPSHAHRVDLSKLKPAQLNKNTLDALNSELENASDNDKVQKFMFSAYLKAMRRSECWAGQHQIHSIQKLLQCRIFLISEKNSTFIIDDERDNSVNICLFNTNKVHYEFGLVKPQIVIENIRKLNYKVASVLVKIGLSDVNYLYNNDWTLLHFATLTNDFQSIIKHLVWQGADVNLATKNNHTPLQMAEFFELRKAITSLQSLTSKKPLAIATLPNKSDNENQMAVNEKNSKTNNYLMISSCNNIIIKPLFNIPAQNITQKTPLPPAILDKAFDFVLKLIDKKICSDINLFNIRLKDNGNNNSSKEFSNWSPLHYAVDKKHLVGVMWFCEHGKAKIDVKDHNGATPLYRAAKNGRLRVLEYLLEKGADINTKDKALVSALLYAAVNGHDRIVDFLIKNGAETVVYQAVQYRRWNAVKCLIEHKADVNVPGNNDKTPLKMLVESGQWDMVKCLLQNGALLMGLSKRQKQNIYQLFILNSGKDFQLSRAICLGNVELLEKLISENQRNLDKPMFKTYHNLELMNVPLTQNMRLFIENKLMNDNYFSKKQLAGAETKVDDNAENIKRRIKLTAKCVDALENSLKDNNNEIDDIFLFHGKCIAKNMQILKRQLRWTYELLPWEEMQFYLVTFLFSYIQPNEVDDITYLVIHETKLIKNLLMFKKELEKLDVVAELMTSSMSKTREEVKVNIIGINPQLKDLYDDFERIKDVHSLKRVETYVKVACSVDLNAKPIIIGQLAIERALQVMGECLKNTRDSPSLSDHVKETLLTFAPRNLSNILTTLRDSLSHEQTLAQTQNIKKSRSVNYYKEIQNDLIKLQPDLAFVSFRKKCVIVKAFLEQIISSQNTGDICVNSRAKRYWDICKLENQGNNNYYSKKISDYVNQLKSLLIDRMTPLQAECFQKIDNFINLKKKNEEIENNHGEYLSKIKSLIDLIKSRKDIGDIHRLARSILSQFQLANYSDVNRNVRQLFSQFVSLRDSVQNFVQATRIVNQILHVIKFETEKVPNIDEFKQNFNKNQSIDFIKKQLDNDILNFIGKISDNVEQRNQMIEEFEAVKQVHNRKTMLINYFTPDTFSSEKPNEHQFRIWLEKINFKFKLAKKETVSSLYGENDIEKCRKIIQRINRQTTGDSYGELVKKTLKQKSTADFSNDIREFIRSFKNVKLNENSRKQENTISKAFLFKNIKTLNEILADVKSDSDLLVWLKTKDDFRAAIEMLMLKITETLGNLKVFETHTTFLDESIPILIGKNLRNYLAHGDLLIDLLSIYHLKSIIFHIRSIQKYCSEADLVVYDDNKRIGNSKVENIKELEKDYETSLKLLTKQKQLINVVKENNMKSLLNYNEIELKYRNFNGWTLLFYTAETDNLKMFIYLIETNNQTSIHYQDKLGYSILYYLAKFGSISILKYLIEHKLIIPNVTLRNGKSILHISAQYGQNEIAKFVLKSGIGVNVTDESERTAILLALMNNHVDVVSTLIKAKADLNYTHFTGTSLLHYAAMHGCAQVLQLLLKTADKNLRVGPRNTFSQTPLHFACLCGHGTVFEILIKNGADINAVADFGLTPLLCAAKEGHEPIVTFLLKHKVNVSLVTSERETALHLAAFSGHVKVVQILLKNGFDPNAKTLDGCTPLHSACSSNHYDVIKLLLVYKADINAANAEGYTPFHKVAEVAGDAEFIKILLERGGVDINYAANNGCTPLHLAAQSNSKQVVELLLKHSANINARVENGGTALHFAVVGRRIENIESLLESNATIECDDKGFTCVYSAVELGYEKVVKSLISKYNINGQFEGGNTLLHLAAILNNGKIVKLLLENGADVKRLDEDGCNAFHLAIKYVSKQVIKIMLNANTDLIDLQSEKGISPLQMASLEGSVDLVKILLDKGASVNLTPNDDNKCTALHLAAANGYSKVVKCLLDNGANANAKTSDGFTPLHVLNCPQLFAEGNLVPKNYSPKEKQTNRVKSAQCLIKARAEVNALNICKRSPLHLAVLTGLHAMIEVLCRNNALLDARDCANLTPLDYAILKGDIRCIMYLLMFGAADPRGCLKMHFTELF